MKISCVCGYVYEEKNDSRSCKVIQGKKPFNQITIASCRKDVVVEATVNNPDNGGYYSPDDYDVELLACPKCGTIRIQHFALTEKD
jgi:hypothetical protein